MKPIHEMDERHAGHCGKSHGHTGDEIHHVEQSHGFHGEAGRGRHGWAGFERGHHERGPRGREHFGGRARRGEVRYVLMDALRSGPKHGYEIVKTLGERSGGRYVPSPGTVYPTMQYLQDAGFVSVDQDGDRRVFQLTDAGKVELEAHATEVEAFWGHFEARGVAQASRHEMSFLEEELESLNRTIWGGLDEAIERGDQEMIRRVRQAVERCRDDIRGIISGG
ncbi:MAG: PadR family transcriptional regulator [Chloroflexi bacterium]|nr:PadR family transcriptional regulator [Chloroflexota bacterium]